MVEQQQQQQHYWWLHSEHLFIIDIFIENEMKLILKWCIIIMYRAIKLRKEFATIALKACFVWLIEISKINQTFSYYKYYDNYDWLN